MPDDDKPVNRRRFFRESLRELLKPLSRAVAPLERAAAEIAKLEDPLGYVPPPPPQVRKPEGAIPRGNEPAPPQPDAPSGEDLSDHRESPTGTLLRPPGAVSEEEFLSKCSRCYTCVSVCPVSCIKIDPSYDKAAGAPYIEVDSMPCMVCDGLYCMNQCPSGALQPTPLAQVDMGDAVWHEETCLRSSGDSCTICVDRCPVGNAAIEVKADKIHVKDDGCIGCGVCQYYCPTHPKSIVVIPKNDR